MNRPRTQGGQLRPANPRLLGFADRVMAQVAAEPRPTPARVFVRSTVHLHLRDAAAALATAWHLAFGRTGPIPALVRVQSLVVLLAFTVAVGTGGTLAAAGAVRVIEGPREPRQVDRPLVLPPLSPGPNVGQPPGVRISPSPSPSGLQRQTGSERATDGEVRSRGNGEKAEEKGTSQKKKQPAEATPKPATQNRSGSDSPKAGSDGGGDKSGSGDAGQKGTAPSTPKPQSGDGAKSQDGADGGSGRGS